MLHKVLLSLLFFISFSLTVNSQELAPPKSIAALKTMLENEMQKQHIAGMMLTIVTKDTTLTVGSLGYADYEKKTLVTEKHLFRQASITKLFVAMGIFNLIKRGKIALNTRLKTIAPNVVFSNKWEETNPVTIEQLLEHTTGFSNKSPFEEYDFSSTTHTEADALVIFRKYMVSKWRPGERFAYSNINYAILAYVIETISKKTLNTYLSETVFEPLNMPFANVNRTHSGLNTYTKGYFWKNGAFQIVPHQPQYSAGNGSLNASAVDYENALKAFLNNNGILSRVLINQLEIPQTGLYTVGGLKNNYGRGCEAKDIGGHVFHGHSGAIGGFLSSFFYNRNLGLGYAFSVNTYNEQFYNYVDNLIGKYILQNISHPEVMKDYKLKNIEIKPYLGYYRLGNPNQLYTGFLETLQHTFKLTEHGNVLCASPLLGGSMTWKAADSTKLFFRMAHINRPHIAFLKDNSGQLVITDNGLYFNKIGAIEAWLPIVLTIVSLIIILSTLLFSIINIVLFFVNKIDKIKLIHRLIPLVATIGLLAVVVMSLQFTDYVTTAQPMASITFGWNVGKYIFASLTLFFFYFLIFRKENKYSGLLKGYMWVVAFAQLYTLYLLVYNRWYF